MGGQNFGRKLRPWSKLKSRIEDLWVPELSMAIHCNVYTTVTKEFSFDAPRHWVALRKHIIWDFPGPFMKPNPERGKPIEYWEEQYGWNGAPSHVANLLRTYLDRPREKLMEPFDDSWELADILCAADRRLGPEALLKWAATLDAQHPALKVIAARVGQQSITSPTNWNSKSLGLRPTSNSRSP